MRSASILPGLAWIRSYQRAYLPRDLFAGVALTAVLVPAGMGYAEASGLPAIVGLYASIIPLIAYALLGPSRRRISTAVAGRPSRVAVIAIIG